ncbi:MAG: type II 3-dehydroquinate dehydratase [Acidimicrobiales bacterium]
MSRTVLILNGPNLNLLGMRETDVYGDATLDDIVAEVQAHAASIDVAVEEFQSNVEGELIDRLHTARSTVDGVVFNPGAFTHYSYALRDAIAATELPVVETHLSNVHAREEFRHRTVLAAVCLGVVAGFGRDSYRLAFDALMGHLDRQGSAG